MAELLLPHPEEDRRSVSKDAAQAPLPELTGESFMSNQRLAHSLAKIHGVGDLPRFTSDALDSAGDVAVVELADLIGTVHKRNPQQARELYERTVAGPADSAAATTIRRTINRMVRVMVPSVSMFTIPANVPPGLAAGHARTRAKI